MQAGFHVTPHGNVVFGKEFPEHIQVAYGRNIARLCSGVSFTSKVWLRDLPLNLWDLADMGYPHALAAYEAELAHIEGANNEI